MTLLIFIIILGVLVLVHEMGHFLAAKKARVYVEEFGFGYPPRMLKLGKRWGTLFSINWIPFGGFVKILGENYEADDSKDSDQKRFGEVSKGSQAAILAAGVIFNFLFGWLLFSIAFWSGIPAPVQNEFGREPVNPALTIIEVLPNSPAEKAGLKSGDKITSLTSGDKKENVLTPENASLFISNSISPVNLTVVRGKEEIQFNLSPETGIVNGKRIIGVGMDLVGTLTLPVGSAVFQGAKTTFKLSYLTAQNIATLIRDGIKGQADFSSVSGPIGIIGLVGDASRLGFAYLISFAALISINLAVINLLPFPALDGGRILFVIYEGLSKKNVSPKFAQIANSIGFALLMIVMIIVTWRDVMRLF